MKHEAEQSRAEFKHIRRRKIERQKQQKQGDLKPPKNARAMIAQRMHSPPPPLRRNKTRFVFFSCEFAFFCLLFLVEARALYMYAFIMCIVCVHSQRRRLIILCIIILTSRFLRQNVGFQRANQTKAAKDFY